MRPYCTNVLLLFIFIPVSHAALTSLYQWPSPQYDALEEFLYEGLDTSRGLTVANLAAGCQSRIGFSGGPPVGAEWLRLAYHDMSTHNVTDGTGGLDASMYYEYLRPENVGEGITDSLHDFSQSANKYVSSADIIAMGAVWGIAACGGPAVPFRGGRIDASAAGRSGVPQPQDGLKSHAESFRLQGFSETEMIGLVACGHTIGGVRHVDFPDIVPLDAQGDARTSIDSFDATFYRYDSTIVSEYLNGTSSKDPLIMVSNTTLQSDLRIFSSDGNVTMKSMASPAAFSQQCASLISRMIDTVPANVNLTDEITFIPFKIIRPRFTVVNSQPVFTVSARIQVQKTGTLTGTLLWCDRRGNAAGCSDGQVNFARATVVESHFLFPIQLSPLATALGITVAILDFTVPLGSASVGAFWFEIRNDTTVIEDNNGAKYMIEQDALIGPSPASRSEMEYPIEMWVLGETEPTSAQVHVIDKSIRSMATPGTSTNVTVLPRVNNTLDLARNISTRSAGGYNLYSVKVNSTQSATLDFAMELNGTRYTIDFQPVSVISGSTVDLAPLKVGKRALGAVSSGAMLLPPTVLHYILLLVALIAL